MPDMHNFNYVIARKQSIKHFESIPMNDLRARRGRMSFRKREDFV